MSRCTRSIPVFLSFVLIALAAAAPAFAGDVEVQLDAATGFVVVDSAGTTERLRVDEATGNISRNGALFVHTTGNNTFVGENAGSTGTTGVAITAFGRRSLQVNSTGNFNSAFGESALNSNGAGLFNSAFGANALVTNTSSSSNSAFGYASLLNNTAGDNSAFGAASLKANTTGTRNTAFGSGALTANTTTSDNTAFGFNSLAGEGDNGGLNAAFGSGALSNFTGNASVAIGYKALHTITGGGSNIAIGFRALYNSNPGVSNIAIGTSAGSNQTTGNFNIYIGNFGVAGEESKIKIGDSQGETFIAGINGNTATGGVAVLVNSSNELHTVVSSARFKQDIHDMAQASDVLLGLRPVTFRYREHADQSDALEYGLIAEEVAELAPDLVVRDEDGAPYSVRYHLLAPMLLNEVQEQHRALERQRREIEQLKLKLASLEGSS